MKKRLPPADVLDAVSVNDGTSCTVVPVGACVVVVSVDAPAAVVVVSVDAPAAVVVVSVDAPVVVAAVVVVWVVVAGTNTLL